MRNPVDGTGRLSDLAAEGVSPWLDGLDRRLLDDGWFASVVGPRGLRGVVADPATLVDSLRDDRVHRDRLGELAGRRVDVDSAALELALDDARTACDFLRGVFVDSEGRDGFVSVELPAVRDAAAAVAASVRIVAHLARPNVTIKIPATDAGLVAMRACLSRGIGVLATEVYSPGRYRQVAGAWFDGLEAAAAAGLSLAGLSSAVAVPVGWIDTEIDAQIDTVSGARPAACSLRGRAGLATARLLYEEYEQQLGSMRWRALHAAGAHPQRLAWATASARGTGVAYAGQILGWGTVTVLPSDALSVLCDAVEHSGDTLLGERESAAAVIEDLATVGIDVPAVVRRLEERGADRTAHHWDELRAVVRARLGDPAC